MSNGQNHHPNTSLSHQQRAPRSGERTIVIRDRRKPNQYTTDNIIAREWLPILRVGDAFFFYSVYLSMANRETESSWGSLRTQAEYLQCGVDLIVRGNKLLEICELLYIESGDYRTTNEYYILDPPHLTPELQARIHRRLDQIESEEVGKNWLSWVKQVRKALDRYKSLPSIWQERRNRKGGRPVSTVLPPKSDRGSQTGLDKSTSDTQRGACDSHAPYMWDTCTPHVSHNQGACESHAKQEQIRKVTKHSDQEMFVRNRCACLKVSPAVVESLLNRYSLEDIQQQLNWLPSRNARDPAAMLVSALQNSWDAPTDHDARRASEIWASWMNQVPRSPLLERMDEPPGPLVTSKNSEQVGKIDGIDLEPCQIWQCVLDEMQLQMTRSAFDTWLRGSQVVRVKTDTLTVGVRDEYAVEWLNARWIVPVERTLAGVTGRSLQLRFEVL